MDGVLTDSEPLINAAAIAMFAERGVAVAPEDFRSFIGRGEDRYIGGVALAHGVTLDVAEAKRRTYELYFALARQGLRAFPGAIELVRACRARGLLVALASGGDRVRVDVNLEAIGLPPPFWDAVVAAEDAVRKKPAPDLFLAAARSLEVAAAACAVIEDAVNGVRAAKAAGMRCVAVAQTFRSDQLSEADLVRARVADVTVDELIAV